jgi:hypothetical protein
MKSMKRHIFSILTVLMITGVATAQDMRFGLLGGVNLQNINGKDNGGDKLENTLIPGFHAGVNILIPIADQIYFQPGLLFSSKGAELFDNDLLDFLNTKIRMNYLEVPLNLVYRGQLGDNFILLGLGPYLAYALNGNLIIGDTKTELNFDNEVGVFTGLVMRRFDAGANIFAGYELGNGLFFQLNAQLGLLNINPEVTSADNDERAWKNTGFGLSAGYRF